MSTELMRCAQAVAKARAGAHLDQALDDVLGAATGLPAASAAAVRDMAYATLRRQGLLGWLAARLNAREPAPALGALQGVALEAILDGRRAAPIVLDQAVGACRELLPGTAGQKASGFVNATLRRFVRERDTLLAQAALDRQAAFNHPAWWLDLLERAYPDRWPAIAAADLVHAPLTLRVNRRATSLQAMAATLLAAGIAHRRTGDAALTLLQALPVERIPGFADGLTTVQDAGAQLAGALLAPRDGERILDACAAPGGKTTHLLQLADCHVLAIDADASRLGRIGENLARERLPVVPAGSAAWGATIRHADAARPADWWDGTAFDRIMLDAPCSASGIARRHPDVIWHRRRSDIATFAAQQSRLLQALWPLLKPGGTLLYVTCSVFPQEGEAVITAFCSRQAGCVRRPIAVSWPDGEQALTQLVPTSDGRREHDGYFYALLSKQT